MSVPASHNRLLALLPEEDRQHLVAQSEAVSLQRSVELYLLHGRIDSVYFPLTMVASILIRVAHGREVEMATIGNEGMLHSLVVLGVPRALGRTGALWLTSLAAAAPAALHHPGAPQAPRQFRLAGAPRLLQSGLPGLCRPGNPQCGSQ